MLQIKDIISIQYNKQMTIIIDTNYNIQCVCLETIKYLHIIYSHSI